MTALIDGHDAALFDLDGVIYLGPDAIPGVPDHLARLRAAGVHVGFVTNNAARTPSAVAAHLSAIGVDAAEADVVNSTMATLRMLEERLAPGAAVLPVGTEALAEQLRGAGYRLVAAAADGPLAVVQGYDPALDWGMLEQGALAVQGGAQWFVTNPDLTRPSERGLVPGCGAQVYAIRVCVDADPAIAGKPHPPLLEATVERLGAERPIFVGDRLDTDILGANTAGMDSLFVFTGAHGKRDLLHATPDHRPTAIGADVGALLQPARTAVVDGASARCRDQFARIEGGRVVVDAAPEGLEPQMDALWAVLQLAWTHEADATEAVQALGEVR